MLYLYVLIQPLHHKQDVTQGQLFSTNGVKSEFHYFETSCQIKESSLTYH